MAYSSMNVPTTHIAAAMRGILGENCGLRRSSSGDELCKQASIKRSCSDNNLLCSSSRLQAAAASSPSARSSKLKPSRSFGIFSLQITSSVLPGPIRSLLLDTDIENQNQRELDDSEVEEEMEEKKVKRGSWVERLLELRMRWKGRQEKDDVDGYEEKEEDGDEDGCPVEYGEREEKTTFDSESFSRFLNQVPWSDAKRFSKLAFLCHKAYKIPEIKAHDLQRDFSLHFVTSSLEKKAEAIAVKAKLDKDSTNLLAHELAASEPNSKKSVMKKEHVIRTSVAYEIAASAASHVQCRAKNESYSRICGEDTDYMGDGEMCSLTRGCKSEKAAQMAASTMTAVVAAKEREKQEAAKELQSLHSSPCEWFICDDPSTCVRFFVIQGSESLASWQTNLFFEPTKFEETDALVHRGIYEAAKGIYEQFMPEIQNHINAHGDDAKFQFTGHSLGGSLSLLVHMMLVARRAVKPSTLLPVVTFGSPFVFCGGQRIVEQLGVDESQVHCVILHRDIVPRAFSCNYPRQVAQVLKRLNGSFRSHPCLNKHKMLYSPLGQIFILQPAEKSSPSHPLLPSGCALYAFDRTQPATSAMALRAFLNTPHPLETLSDPTAYGSEGTILRDHDSNNYAKAVNGVMRQYTKMAFRKVRKERHLVWPVVVSPPSRHAWTHESNLENRSTRKEVVTSV